jgi:hypothetical protein
MTTTETITGRIEARNATGVKVQGRWGSVSRFKPLELPQVGTEVSIGLDPKGFLTSLEVLGQTPVVADAPGAARTVSMARLEVLKAAAHFAAARRTPGPATRSRSPSAGSSGSKQSRRNDSG